MAKIIEITDLSAPGLEMFARLTEPQLRCRLEPEKGIFIAEGKKIIQLALASGCRPAALLMERKRLEGAGRELIENCGEIPVYTGDREVLAGLTGYTLTRGILAAFYRPALPEAESICRGAKRIAVLDSIADAANVGAIFRSAAALNVDAVLVRESCCDPWCRHAVRVSMGTIFQVPWTRWDGELSQLTAWGFKTAALALSDDSVSIADRQLQAEPKLALLFGSEGYGLPAATIAACDYTVKIPMAHQVDSLNVAAASAVTFWELRVR